MQDIILSLCQKYGVDINVRRDLFQKATEIYVTDPARYGRYTTVISDEDLYNAIDPDIILLTNMTQIVRKLKLNESEAWKVCPVCGGTGKVNQWADTKECGVCCGKGKVRIR